MSTVAVFVALGGSAAALGVNTIGPLQIRSNAVGPTEIQNNAITSNKVRPGSLLGSDFKTGQLPKGDRGLQGAIGPAGLNGANGTSASLPAGMVVFFNQSSCPSGFSEFTDLRGRYPVGLPAGGSANTTVGTALSNVEDRPVGKHNHNLFVNPHAHSISVAEGVGSADPANSVNRLMITDSANGQRTINSGDWTDFNTVADQFGNGQPMVAGTNAPYVQLIACRTT
jgi:hypothetical protein